jgi:hypothetical protein
MYSPYKPHRMKNFLFLTLLLAPLYGSAQDTTPLGKAFGNLLNKAANYGKPPADTPEVSTPGAGTPNRTSPFGTIGKSNQQSGTAGSTGQQGANTNPKPAVSLQTLGNFEIIGALREALNVSAKNAAKQLNVTNGYAGNKLIRIVMPEEASKVERTLREMGLGGTVDKTITSMNRAAEDAAAKAAPILIQAITSMSIEDALKIVKRGNGAATEYLKEKTNSSLSRAFKPVVEQSLNKVRVAPLWNQVFKTYNFLPSTRKKVNPDLVSYVTEKALEGLYITMAQEENKIRENPAARVTSLLEKVFGAR